MPLDSLEPMSILQARVRSYQRMNKKRSIADYKMQAREQLLGNYRIAVGSLALLFALLYMISTLVVGTYAQGFGKNMLQFVEEGKASSMQFLQQQIVMVLLDTVVGVFSALFAVGYLYILRELAQGRTPRTSDIFYCFKNHPDKVIIITLIVEAVSVIASIPGTIIQYKYINFDSLDTLNGKMFFIWIVVQVATTAIVIYVGLAVAFSYYVYLDDVNKTAMECMKKSCEIMKGNKFRLFYAQLSMLGYMLLGAISLGIALLWVVPYQGMMIMNFYDDVKGGEY